MRDMLSYIGILAVAFVNVTGLIGCHRPEPHFPTPEDRIEAIENRLGDAEEQLSAAEREERAARQQIEASVMMWWEAYKAKLKTNLCK